MSSHIHALSISLPLLWSERGAKPGTHKHGTMPPTTRSQRRQRDGETVKGLKIAPEPRDLAESAWSAKARRRRHSETGSCEETVGDGVVRQTKRRRRLSFTSSSAGGTEFASSPEMDASITNIPNDVFDLILSKLSARDLCALECSSKAIQSRIAMPGTARG